MLFHFRDFPIFSDRKAIPFVIEWNYFRRTEMKNDLIALNSLRGLSLDVIAKAKSGHPGICLSAAPLVYTLFTRHLIADPGHPNWINRDRFVLSCGHASALLYSLLHLAGYPIPMDQLKQFRQLGSITPGHPELGHTPGVDTTSGPLGQGLAQSVGLAIAETHIPELYPEGSRLISHYTYVLCGDGCLEEGISQEAINMAGILKLNKLILLYDRNDCTLDGPLSASSNEDVRERFLSAGWNVLLVEDGNDIEAIDKAIIEAKMSKEKPTIIICHTRIGFGSPLEGTHESHGKAFSLEEVRKTKENLNCVFDSFDVPADAYEVFRETFIKRGRKAYQKYEEATKIYAIDHPEEYREFTDSLSNDITTKLFSQGPKYEDGFKEATRNVSQNYLNLLSENVKNLMGGSADVADSVKTHVKLFSDYSDTNRAGQNINFGIREFEMASIQNGLLLHRGLRTYVGSFLVFADYMKPAIRMAAMERLPAVYLFSHDSLAVGEDGPTHQPIEQTTMLRTIPNVVVYRPADAIETGAAYRHAFASTDHPTCILLSRQALKNNPESSFEKALLGGYVISREKEKADLTVIATGSEVNLACDVQRELLKDGIDIRVVSMPSIEVFLSQPESYQNEVLGNTYEKRVFIEMGKGDTFYRFAKNVISQDTYGCSAPAKDVLDHFGFNVSSVSDRIRSLLR